MVKITKFVTSSPIFVFFVLASLVIVFGSIPITIWRTTTKNVTNDFASFTESSLVSQIENIGKFIYPNTNSSTIGLARVIDSYYLTNNQTHFADIQTKIAPLLFQAYSTIPEVSQVSYITTQALSFSYINVLNKTFAVFANSSDGYYTQTVDQITGGLTGNAKKSQPLDVTKFQENYTVAAFVGTGLGGGDGNETMFQSVVRLNNTKGVVSLGFSVKTFIDALNRLNLRGVELYVWNKEGTVLVREGSLNISFFMSNGSACSSKEPSQCIPESCGSRGCRVEIKRSKFQAYCSVLEVSGVPLRYTLMFPNKGGGESRIKNASLYLLIATMFLGLCWPLAFVVCMIQAARKEMHMRATLIYQMEATQQAERKSMNKTQAFGRASHDIRGSLAGITGLIDLCREGVSHGSELDTSLKQVNVCTKDLTALLNSVLDMSKIESGMMQLEENEFNLVEFLEDVVDFFHPVAMKKGVDVVLDLQDGSVFKYSNVIGDSGKLKQILNNLVSNAVKFTDDGHISIRAWAKRLDPNSYVVMASSDSKGSMSKFSKAMFCSNKDRSSTSNSVRSDANTMEFVFEVEDTGKGIPMEMRKSVFENYVQVKETAQGQQGTGLGLGIVQSLVRLMGGEIRIIDKAIGEKGTCFQFNVLLTKPESVVSEMKVKPDTETGGDNISTPNLGLAIKTSLGGSMNLRNMSPRFNNLLSLSPKPERSRVVLLLKDEERRRVTESYIKSLGIKVIVVEKWEHLSHALEKLLRFSPQSSIGRAECSSRNEISSPSSRELPLIGMDGIDSRSQVPRRGSNSFSATVLLVIDAKAGPFSELYNIVEQFRRGLLCKVVWLNEPSCRGSERGDISYSKPLHGSRLNRVLKMLPEFGGAEPKDAPPIAPPPLQRESILRHSHVESENEAWTRSVCSGLKPTGNQEDEQRTPKPSDNELLSGKRVLVVDDNPIASLVATRKLKKIGVSDVKQCDSGKEAVRLVVEWLTGREQEVLPFDYIFMDCEMPEMDGYEATREIRKAERRHGGVHIPIIAVSGHDPCSTEAREAVQAGMDAFLEKSLSHDQLVKVIREIKSRNKSFSSPI